MLRIFRVDTSNAYTVYPFQFLRVKEPFLKYGHICVLTRNVLCVSTDGKRASPAIA